MFFRYLAALLYDCFILLALFFAFTIGCLLANQGKAILPATLWYQLGLSTIALIYYVWSIHRGGQTIGMRAWRLQLLSHSGLPSRKQAALRWFLSLPAFALAIISLRNPQELLHQWTGTRLQAVMI